MPKGDPDFSYINEKGRRVVGPPAFLHEVYTVRGGIKGYNDLVGTKYIKAFVESISEDVQSNLEAEARRRHFKITKNDKRKLG